MGVENDIFWSEKGSGFGETGGTPPLRIPKSKAPTWGKYWYFFLWYWQQLIILLNSAFVLSEEYYYKDRGEAEADNTLQNLHNSLDDKKAKFNNSFIIHSK